MPARPVSPRSAVLLATLLVLAGFAGVAVRAWAAFATPDVLDWDETYYTSTTATAAAGIGLFPYVQGYPEIPSMGGVGYAIYAYAAAYSLVGPDLMVLRAVAFALSLLALAGVVTLTARLYGSAPALVAFAITPALLAFHGTNTIRMDAAAVAVVAWGLVLYTKARDRNAASWHVLVGLAFALGLEVHLHTAAASFALGVTYLAEAVASAWRERRLRPLVAGPLAAFLAGYAAGAAVFLALSVLPSPESYFRTAALARLSAVESDATLNLSAPMDHEKLAASFLSPAEIGPKEITRYRNLFRGMTGWERLLWLGGVPLFLLLRHTRNRFPARLLLPGAVIGGGIVLNSASPVYFAPLLPFFVPALATLVTHGFSPIERRSWRNVPVATVAIGIALSAALVHTARVRGQQAVAIAERASDRAVPHIVDLVRHTASTSCILAGPTEHYATHFMAYPRFVGTREAEVLIGSTYYDLGHDRVAYWRAKHPDVVFGPVDAALAAYLREAGFTAAAENIWVSPRLSAGCVIAAPEISSR